MKKAIVIIDVPEYLDIKQCKVKCEILNGGLTSNYIGYLNLKPLPQKKNVDEEFAKYCEDYDKKIGWNECINEILGEKE